jgi:hypothetical protein
MAVMEAISTLYLEADAVSVTTATLPTDYQHLQVCASLRGPRASSQQLYFRPNSDSASVYSFGFMEGVATTETGNHGFTSYAYANLREIPYLDSSTTSYGTFVIDILDYRNANKNKTIKWQQGMNGVENTDPNRVMVGEALWDSTAAITTLHFYTIGTGFSRGSSISVYGLKNS